MLTISRSYPGAYPGGFGGRSGAAPEVTKGAPKNKKKERERKRERKEKKRKRQERKGGDKKVTLTTGAPFRGGFKVGAGGAPSIFSEIGCLTLRGHLKQKECTK